MTTHPCFKEGNKKTICYVIWLRAKSLFGYLIANKRHIFCEVAFQLRFFTLKNLNQFNVWNIHVILNIIYKFSIRKIALPIEVAPNTLRLPPRRPCFVVYEIVRSHNQQITNNAMSLFVYKMS